MKSECHKGYFKHTDFYLSLWNVLAVGSRLLILEIIKVKWEEFQDLPFLPSALGD